MNDFLDKELDFLRDQGILSNDQISDLREKAIKSGGRPTAILRQQGKLTEEETNLLAAKIDQSMGSDYREEDSWDAPTRFKDDSLSGAATRSQENPELRDGANSLDAGLMIKGRYQVLDKAGSGGMGDVYRAYDFQLKRKVAIKFLNDNDPNRVERFIYEARAQAGVEHEHICKVFEVDQEGERPFIVMQLIPGETLDQAARNMTLEQKILVLQQIAEGVHEAHRRGLIHRDLKPGNIMVDRTEQGAYKPFILDFGLAHSVAESGRTLQGELLGTPAYMAPEQALGRIDQIDRRTDVYSLGATLYRLLTGEPPMGRGRGAELLLRVQHEEPKPPRRENPEIPRDLETITLKCLEKSPSDRYASARALADDLNRYLNGDPILAKPASLVYRVWKKVLKNKTAAVIGAVSGVALVVLLVYAVHLRWQGKIREELTRVFTEHVKEVEALSRHTFLSRRHDIRPDRVLLSQHMEAIRAEMQRAGSVAAGLGHYSLGKVHMVQGDLSTAHHHLMRAWESGYDEPRVAYAISLTLGGLYREKLGQIQLLPEKVDRERRRAELEREYLSPALEFISRIADFQAESAAYSRALLAYYDNRLEKALELLTLAQAPPWFYETIVLEADIYRELAVQNHDAGNMTTAKDYSLKALAAFERARSVAESDFKIYRSRGQTLLQLMMMETFSDTDLTAYLEQGLQEVDWALEIDVDDPETWLLKSKLNRGYAYHLAAMAKDPLPSLDASEEAASCALIFGGEPSRIMLDIGQIHWQRASWLNDKRKDASEAIEAASSALARTDPRSHDYSYFNSVGMVHKNLADARARSGADAQENYRQAADAFRNALALQPDRFGLYNNLAICLYRLSEQQSLQVSPMQPLREAVDALEAALRIQPDHVILHYQLGRTYLRLAQQGNINTGALDEALVAQVLDHYQKALELNPKLAHLYNVLARVYFLKAIYEWEEGRSPDAWFAQSISTYEQGQALAPKSRRIYQNMAWVYYYQGKFKVREGHNPEPDFRQAVTLLNHALEEGKDIEAILCLASVDRLRAEYALLTGGRAAPLINKARDGLLDVLKMNPNFAEGYRSLGRLATLEARMRISDGEDPEQALAQGREAIDQALALERQSPYFYLADARWSLLKSIFLVQKGLSPTQAISHGLKSTDQTLAIRPGLAEALLIASALAKVGADAESGREVGSVFPGTETVAALLNAHPNLRYQWQHLLRVDR